MNTNALIICSALILSGCGYGKGRVDAVAHFNAHAEAIQEFTAFYLAHRGIDYVEFRASNSVDLWVLDKDQFNRKSSPAIFKFHLFGVPIHSPDVSNALNYASVSQDTFMTLKNYADRSGCISIEKPFWDDSPVEVEVGFARHGLSKSIYRKIKSGVNVTNLVSLPPWRDDYLAPLTGNWILVIGRGACN